MSRKYKFHNPDGVYFVSFAVQGWVDVFTRNEYKNILIDNLAYCHKHNGLELFAWCIMTNHVHLILSSDGRNKQEDIIRDFKLTCWCDCRMRVGKLRGKIKYHKLLNQLYHHVAQCFLIDFHIG